MKRRIIYNGSFAWVVTIVLLSACSKNNDDSKPVVFKANGDINGKLNEFRNILGVQLNTTPGAVGGHERCCHRAGRPDLPRDSVVSRESNVI